LVNISPVKYSIVHVLLITNYFIVTNYIMVIGKYKSS
jgi:hypothetical protein